MNKQKLNNPDLDLPAGLAQPAIRALTGAGITRIEHLANFTESEITKLHGMGPNAIAKIREALDSRGLKFAAPGKG
jgi:predicted RecB family nuclease